MKRRLPFKRGPEEGEMITFFDYCRWKGKVDQRYNMIFHVPNESKSSPQRRISMKRAGLKAGVPDIVVAVPAQGWGALFMEMKVKPNKPTEAQEQWIHDLNKIGYRAQVVWSASEAIQVLECYFKGENK